MKTIKISTPSHRSEISRTSIARARARASACAAWNVFFCLLLPHHRQQLGASFQFSPRQQVRKDPMHSLHAWNRGSIVSKEVASSFPSSRIIVTENGRHEQFLAMRLYARPGNRRGRSTPTATATSTSTPSVSSSASSSSKLDPSSSTFTSPSSTDSPSNASQQQQHSHFHSDLHSLLDDGKGKGHINPELATAIYQWEMAHSHHAAYSIQHLNEEGKPFSTRDGLRLVDELAREMLDSFAPEMTLDSNDDEHEIDSSQRGRRSGRRGEQQQRQRDGEGEFSESISYNDLVQEGMIALLRSMATYDNYKSKTLSKHEITPHVLSFEKYAKNSIRSSLLQYVSSSSLLLCPIRIPPSLLETASRTLRAANEVASNLRERLGREPSLTEVAKGLTKLWRETTGEEVTLEQLKLYRKLYATYLRKDDDGSIGSGRRRRGEALVSLENLDGLEVYNDEIKTSGENKDDDITSLSSSAAELSLSSLDPADELVSEINTFPSDDDDGLLPRDITDILTDEEEINNPLSYIHHSLLNESLDKFLKETLDPLELKVIRLRFGFMDKNESKEEAKEEIKYGGKGWSFKEVAKKLNMEKEQVVEVAKGALEKLRMRAAEYYEREVNAEQIMEKDGDDGMLHYHQLAYWEDDDPYVEVSL